MCYLAGRPASFIDLLDLHQVSHQEFLQDISTLGLRSGTDQKFFYNQALAKKEIKIKHLERGWIDEKYAYKRLDKAIWPAGDYNINEYIDCHLPRPLTDNRSKCEIS